MAHFRKKPVVVEAIQFRGINSIPVLQEFITVPADFFPNAIYIKTLEGVMCADVNDYIIKGIKGEFYPCKSYIFKDTYELVP